MRRGSLIIAALLGMAQPGVLQAAERKSVNIPSGRVTEVVQSLSREMRVSIGIDPSLANRRAPAIRGSMTAEQALTRIARTLNARVVTVGPTAFRLVSQPSPRRERRPRTTAEQPGPVAISVGADIVVTASKRGVPEGDIPGIVSLIKGDDLTAGSAARGSEALMLRVVELGSTHFGSGRNKLFLGGIAESSFNGPTQATVGQYLGEARVNYSAPDPDLRLFDIDRVEILSGPRGTLYGAGALGGVIKIVPNPPVFGETAAMISAGVSKTWHGDAGGDVATVVNLPLGEKAGFRALGYSVIEGGYIDDLRRGLDDVNDLRIWGGRAAAAAEFGGNWRGLVRLSGQRTHAADAQYGDNLLPPLTRASWLAQPFTNTFLLGEVTASRTLEDGEFVATLGRSRQRLKERFDASNEFALIAYEQHQEIDLLTAEARLTRRCGRNCNWLVGGSLVSNDARQVRASGPPGSVNVENRLRNSITELAVFGEGSLELAQDLEITAGMRMALARPNSGTTNPPPVVADGAERQEVRSTYALLPMLAVTYRASPKLLLFSRYEESFRPGGVGVFGTTFVTYRDDRVAAVEAGVKYGSLFDPFRAAAVISYTSWRDIQADIINLDGRPMTANVGDARIYTIQAQAGWKLDQIRLEGGVIFNHSEIVSMLPGILLAGPEVPNVAGAAARIGVEYRRRFPGAAQLRLNGNLRYVGESILGTGFRLARDQGSWTDISADAVVEFARFAVEIGVHNLLDLRGNRFAIGNPLRFFEDSQVTPLRPRTIRVGARATF